MQAIAMTVAVNYVHPGGIRIRTRYLIYDITFGTVILREIIAESHPDSKHLFVSLDKAIEICAGCHWDTIITLCY